MTPRWYVFLCAFGLTVNVTPAGVLLVGLYALHPSEMLVEPREQDGCCAIAEQGNRVVFIQPAGPSRFTLAHYDRDDPPPAGLGKRVLAGVYVDQWQLEATRFLNRRYD